MKDILQKLGWEFKEFNNRFQGACPLHGGDNETALSIFKDTGIWNCFTHQCHKKYGASFYQFVLKYIEIFSGEVVEQDKILEWLEKNKGGFNYLKSEISVLPTPKIICSREHVLKQLEIPSKYYIERGFSEEILRRHDIGLCRVWGPMYNRNVVPVYNHSFQGMIGCSGRIKKYTKTNPKWMHSKNFPRDLSLYNSWFAEQYVRGSGTVFVVEGPAKVWRLEEAGYYNSVAIFGTSLTLNQKKLLSRMGANKVVLLMDNDDAGIKAAKTIKKELDSLYNVKILKTPFADIDETSAIEVREFIENK